MMTLVVAKRFGERIIIVSDTMITDRGQRFDDIIPGNLKSIVIDSKMTISYSGQNYISIICIRNCKEIVGSYCWEERVFEILLSCSSEHGCEFIVVSHLPKAEIRKVFQGFVTSPQDRHWIGDAAANVLFEKAEFAQSEVKRLSNIVYTEEYFAESNFSSAFSRLMMESTQLTDGVGGFAIEALASPFGHTYQNCAASMRFDTIEIGPHGSYSNEKTEFGGQATWSYGVTHSMYRGVALVGAHIQNNNLGFIYDPLFNDKVDCFRNVDQRSLMDMLDDRAKGRGGLHESDIE